jgi:hypothetical protein
MVFALIGVYDHTKTCRKAGLQKSGFSEKLVFPCAGIVRIRFKGYNLRRPVGCA